jgi:NAD(P)-dependent dehydrogenase (short-subunit alcohol dehydrogenase family)
MARWTANDMTDLNEKVAIVTGANSGIGYVAARELARKGATVVLACRSPERGAAALERLQQEVPEADARFIPLDLADLEKVGAFAAQVFGEYDRLDVLVNNAGVMIPPESRTAQGHELQFGVNHLGHFALTGLLLPLIRRTRGARVVNVSSMAHRGGKMAFDDLNWESRSYGAVAAYGQSKLANLLFTSELARRLEDAGVDATSVAAHPGWTATNLQQHSLLVRLFNPLFGMKPDQGALPTLFAATADEVEANDYIGPGGFMEMSGYPKKVGTNARARSAEDAARLWQLSEEMTGVSFDFAERAPEVRLAS